MNKGLESYRFGNESESELKGTIDFLIRKDAWGWRDGSLDKGVSYTSIRTQVKSWVCPQVHPNTEIWRRENL